jgi:DNA invertase Pin-like site-specific DNA recombinase
VARLPLHSGRSGIRSWTRRHRKGRLLSTLLAAIAEFERDLIRERTGEGRPPADVVAI